MSFRSLYFLIVVLASMAVASCASAGRKASAPAPPEFRVGVWLNRHEMAKGDAAIVRFLDEAAARGVNTIYPNVWFHGAVVYPGSSLAPQHPAFVGRDPLALVLREAHQRGMKVMPWAEYGFFTHFHRTGQGDPGAILKAHPEWALTNRDGATGLENEGMGVTHYSLDPAKPEARRWLADLFLETARLYPAIDGFHVDRIRYMGPEWGYDAASLKAFEAEAGFSPVSLGKDDARLAAWNGWREAQTTAFMAEFSARFRKEFPGRTISGAVVPPYLQPEKFQRWDVWAAKGYIDEVAPMLYGNEALVAKELGKSLTMVPAAFPVIAGIDAAMGPEALKRATQAARQAGAAGVVLWGDDKLAALPVETFR